MKHSPEFLKLTDEAKCRIREITVTDAIRKVNSGDMVHLIDVREDHEWSISRCKSAKHIGRGILERDIEAAVPEKNAEIILYCGGGFRSALSADNLQKMGYTNVWSMAGGFKAWVNGGGPVVSD